MFFTCYIKIIVDWITIFGMLQLVYSYIIEYLAILIKVYYSVKFTRRGTCVELMIC